MWKPSDVRKLIVQLFGITLGVSGVYLIATEAKAGVISIKLDFKAMSSELTTGQAGIYILFFSFFLVLLPTINIKKEDENPLPWYNPILRVLPFISVICSGSIIAVIAYKLGVPLALCTSIFIFITIIATNNYTPKN